MLDVRRRRDDEEDEDEEGVEKRNMRSRDGPDKKS